MLTIIIIMSFIKIKINNIFAKSPKAKVIFNIFTGISSENKEFIHDYDLGHRRRTCNKTSFGCDFWGLSNGDADGGKKSGHKPDQTLAGFRQGATGKASIQFVTIPYDQQNSEARVGPHHCSRALSPSVAAPCIGSSHHNAK